MLGDHLCRHLSDAPSIVTRRMDDHQRRSVVPHVKQTPCGQHPGPVAVPSACAASEHMPSAWAAKSEYQLIVAVATRKQVDAASEDLGTPASRALGLNTLPWCYAPVAIDHVPSMKPSGRTRKSRQRPPGSDPLAGTTSGRYGTRISPCSQMSDRSPGHHRSGGRVSAHQMPRRL